MSKLDSSDGAQTASLPSSLVQFLKSPHGLWLGPLVLGGLATIGIFYFMAVLVSGGKNLSKSDDNENFIEFVRVRPQENLETRTRKLPDKPPEPKTPPKMEPMQQASTPQPKSNLSAMNTPKLEAPLAFGDGAAVGGGGGTGDRGVTPMVRVQPQYPRKAAMEGIEGWVKLRFDVNESGTVENAEVLAAEPPRVFDSAARQAVLNWRYKPQTENGKPVRLNGIEVRLDFQLEK